MYGRATEAEAHSRPTTDLLKTFRGPFKDIMQSKAMRWISQEDLDKHNYKAKQLGAYQPSSGSSSTRPCQRLRRGVFFNIQLACEHLHTDKRHPHEHGKQRELRGVYFHISRTTHNAGKNIPVVKFPGENL